MFRKFSPWLAVLFLLLSNAAMSLGLGDIKLHSGLNQPLKAEIKLLSVESLTKSQIVVNLASEQDFNRAGVEHLFFLRKIRFAPTFNKDGTMSIKLSTKDAIKEPFLDFLVEVNWPNGRVMREYTLLLDPPAFSEVEMGSAPEVAASSSNNSFQPQRVNTNTLAEDNWSRGGSQASSSGNYRVKDADTLWSIARKNRVSNSSIQQAMVSIFNDNPNAFINNNMNELKRGSVLTLDGVNLQNGLTQQQALLEIARQNQLWGGRGSAGTRPDAVLDTADYASTSSTSVSSEPRLKLAAPGEGDVEGSSSYLESEAVTTLIDENESLRSRINDKDERIEKLERLLELQSGLASVGADETIEDSSNFEIDEATLNNVDVDADTEVSIIDTESGMVENTQTETNLLDEATLDSDRSDINQQALAIEESATETAAVKETAINTAPVIEQKNDSFFDSILNLGSMVWMAVISGLLVVFFSFLWVRRQNMAEDEFQESLVIPLGNDFDNDDLPEIADDILAAEMGVDSGYISETELDELGAVDTETNADPLGEADVYLAYGKFDQAERILRKALEDEPERLDLRLKIMECFAETQSLSEFKDQKREILEVLATDDAIAEQVNLMERKAWPDEIEKTDEIPSTEDIFGDLSFGSDDDDELVFPDESNDVVDEISTEDDSDVDVALDFAAVDSNLDDDSETSSNFTAGEFLDEDIDLESGVDELDILSSGDEAIGASTEEGVDFISESELMGSEIDDDVLDELDEEPVDESILELGDIDEASTKLDLARAYIDMEDFEGATEILEEVIAEGSDTQKGEAEKLLQKMN